jgi:membrane associated rhomboid family serine protease
MEIHDPDPAYTGSARARANFRLAVTLSVAFVGLLWFVELLNLIVAPGLEAYGVRPRELAGLPGILFAPLLHAGFEHLLANTPPLLVLGTTMLYLYPRASLKVFPAVYLGPGIAVWIFGNAGVHIGASGLVYGLVVYVLVAGLIRRDRRAIGASLLVCFLYGALTWGVLPLRVGVSWETHLAAAIIGALYALALRRLDVVPRRVYTWEAEPADAGYDAGDGEEWTSPIDKPRANGEERSDAEPPRTLH